MAFSLSPNASKEVVLPMHRDLPEDERPTFHVRAIPSRVLGELAVLTDRDPGRALLVIVQCGLVGWNRVLDAGGRPAPFRAAKGRRLVHGVEIPAGGVEGEQLDLIPFPAVQEIANEIAEMNRFGVADAKN